MIDEMKIRHIFIVIILLFVTIACTKTVVYTDDFGHKTSQVEMKGGVPHGKTILYFNDGENILQETNYKKGKMNGYSTRWFFNGGKEYEEYYVDNVLEGQKNTWDRTGLLRASDSYCHGLLNGNCSKWYDNGQIQIESYYKMGMPDSIWYYYDYYGLEVGRAKFHDGDGTQIAISPNNEIKITEYKKGEPVSDSVMVFESTAQYNELVKRLLYQ